MTKAATDEGRHSFKDPHCKVNRPRTCELRVAAEYTADLAKAGGIKAPELQELFQADFVTERQVAKAVKAVSSRLPANLKEEAQGVLSFLHNPAAAAK